MSFNDINKGRQRAFCALLCILLACSWLPAQASSFTVEAEKAAEFIGLAVMDFNLRSELDDQGRKIRQVKEGDRVQVLSLGETWSLMRFKDSQGYGKNRWLKALHPQQPGLMPPDYPLQVGLARIKTPVTLTVSGYSGNALQPGDLVAIRQRGDDSALVNMMRKEAELSNQAYDFVPFVSIDKAQPGDLLHAFTTFYNARAGGRLLRGRQQNIALAASLLNGRVLSPEEPFSFNQEIGPYNFSRGYATAPIIGGSGEGAGGGVCQLSTTLHLAALALPIQIVDWSLHSSAGVAYAPRWFDASVGAYSDLKLKNALSFSIRVEALAQDGVLTVMIYRAD